MRAKKQKKTAKKNAASKARDAARLLEKKRLARNEAARRRRAEAKEAARLAEEKRLARNEAARLRRAEAKEAARLAEEKRLAKKKPKKQKPKKKPKKQKPKRKAPKKPSVRGGDGVWIDVPDERLVSRMERFPKITQAYIDAFNYAQEDDGRGVDSKIRRHLAGVELDKFEEAAAWISRKTGKELGEIYQLFFSP